MFFKKTNHRELAPDIRSPEGFKQVYQDQVDRLIDLAYYSLRDQDMAQSIVHQVFCTLWARRENLDIHGSVEPYLVRAVKLAVMDHIRVEVNRRKHREQIQADYNHADSSTENQVNYRELLGQVNYLVDQLPPQRQQIYRLSRDQGLKNKEIAFSLQIAEKTVENQLHRALKFLRGKLKEQYL
ncbi:MAG: RNA polymerase sigma-70 factor [Bacteroidota bacterium]